MIKNEKLQIRLSEELMTYMKSNFDNVSLFIREAVREKIETGLLPDSSLSFVEIRCATPYTFFADLDRVVDGDTVVLNFDLGFFLTINVKVRLAGIDTPPIDTKEGKSARDFVEKELKDAHMVVECRKKEKYGRYLCWIYYSKEHKDYEDIIREGKLLNDELVKAGLANKYG